MKNIYIVVLHYNGEKDTIACLNSLKKVKVHGFKLHTVLVDNNPDKRLEINFDEFKPINLETVLSPENVGFSGGNNLGIKKALKNGADYILLLNNDTLVKEDFLEKLFEKAEFDIKIGLITPKIYFAKGYEFHKDRYSEKDKGKVFWYAGGVMDWENVYGHHRGVDEVDEGQFERSEETDFASGCCMLIRREVFDEIGLLDEKYFLYYEDNDFSMRAKKAGYKIIYEPKSIIWHKNAGSTGGSGSNIQDYYITRNRLLFGNKYAPIRAKFALNREGIRFSISGRDMQKKGARDYFQKKLGKMT